MNKNAKYNGFLMTELMVAMAVLITVLACFALSLKVFRSVNEYQLTRQQCISGAQAQLDSIAVTGEPISEKDMQRLWPGMNVEIKQSDGSGQWQGLKLFKVRATAKAGHRDVTIELARYLAAERAGRQ
jgi:type II secretory pathway pseudopilin PulG